MPMDWSRQTRYWLEVRDRIMLFAAAAEAASNGEEQTQTSPENGPCGKLRINEYSTSGRTKKVGILDSGLVDYEMVAGPATPNCLVLPFRFNLIRSAAETNDFLPSCRRFRL